MQKNCQGNIFKYIVKGQHTKVAPSCRVERVIWAIESIGSPDEIVVSSEEVESGVRPTGGAESQLKEVHNLTDALYCKNRAVHKVQWVPQHKVRPSGFCCKLPLWLHSA